jgi:hypothetical protein
MQSISFSFLWCIGLVLLAGQGYETNVLYVFGAGRCYLLDYVISFCFEQQCSGLCGQGFKCYSVHLRFRCWCLHHFATCWIMVLSVL